MFIRANANKYLRSRHLTGDFQDFTIKIICNNLILYTYTKISGMLLIVEKCDAAFRKIISQRQLYYIECC